MAHPRLRDSTRKIAVLNQKGGVGKSTTTLFVACAAVELGARVLIRDMDPQANTTIALGPEGAQYTMNDVLQPDEDTGEVVEGSLASAVRPAADRWPSGLYVVPASLAQSDRENDQVIGREQRLQVASTGALDAFDLVLDDCPPAVGQLTVNALADDTDALIVTTPEYWSIQGAHQARKTIKRVTRYYNPGLRFAGVLINSFKTGRTESRQRVDELLDIYADEVWDPILPDSEVVRKAIGATSPLSAFRREAESARVMYQSIAEQLLNEGEGVHGGQTVGSPRAATV